MRAPIEICDTVVQPGEKVTRSLPVARIYTGTEVSIPVHVRHGKNPGPILFVSAAVHGDEINGVEIIRRLLKRTTRKSISGTLIAIPVVNIFGFLNRTRYLPDRRDLNRCFPGSENGSLTAQLAHLFMEKIVKKCTHGIDLHTGSNHRSNLPHIRADVSQPKTLEMANAFGPPVILKKDSQDGSLRYAGAQINIPMLLYEGGSALRFNESVIKIGLRGVLSVMTHLGMITSSSIKTIKEPLIAKSSTWIRSPRSGIFATRAKLGSIVTPGTKLGKVSDPFGFDSVWIESSVSGVVIGIDELPLTHKGDALYHIAVFKKLEAIEEIIEEYRDEIFPLGNDDVV